MGQAPKHQMITLPSRIRDSLNFLIDELIQNNFTRVCGFELNKLTSYTASDDIRFIRKLINYRNKLNNWNPTRLKINSCLYSVYPKVYPKDKTILEIAEERGWRREYIEDGIDCEMWISPDEKLASYTLPEHAYARNPLREYGDAPTVAEVIKRLQELPQDLKCYVRTKYHGNTPCFEDVPLFHKGINEMHPNDKPKNVTFLV